MFDSIQNLLFMVVVGLASYVASALTKQHMKKDMVDQFLPLIPLFWGALLGLPLCVLFNDFDGYGRTMLLKGLEQGLIAGALSSKIYEQFKRNELPVFKK